MKTQSQVSSEIDTGLCGKGGCTLNIVLAFSERGWTSIIVQLADKGAEPY